MSAAANAPEPTDPALTDERPGSAEPTASPEGPESSRPADPWPAPVAEGPVRGVMTLPGSKSLTNRYLVMASVASGRCLLRGALASRDTALMRDALAALGARFSDAEDGSLVVTPLPVGTPHEGEVRIDCGLAGTVMRFVPLIAALRPGTVHFDGDEGARRRPMGATVDVLRGLGVEVEEHGEPGRLPFTMTVHEFPSDSERAEIEVDASESSQFLSAVLMMAGALRHGATVRRIGQGIPSPEHVAMTVDALSKHGGAVRAVDADTWQVDARHTRPFDVTVEPDLSNAGPFLAAAVVTGGEVHVEHWPSGTTQIGHRWREILPAFGAEVELHASHHDPSGGTLVVRGRMEDGRPVVRGGGEIADTAELAPTVAALALLAEGPTVLTGIGHLRGHETDRLAAITAEAERFGVAVEADDQTLRFPGTPDVSALHGAEAETYEDHRMATFAAVVGLRVPGTTVRNVATTAKTMPDFPGLWSALVHAGQAED